MRISILSGVAALALAAALPLVPAKADVCCEVGGVAITHGGGNTNLATGAYSQAQQSVTTVGGSAGPYGHSLTSGGYNSNAAVGAFSQAHQDVLTVGGSAGYGKNLTYGGGNHNAALGFGSQADQQVVTVGGQ